MDQYGFLETLRQTPGPCLTADPVDLDRGGHARAGGTVVGDLYASAAGAKRPYHLAF